MALGVRRRPVEPSPKGDVNFGLGRMFETYSQLGERNAVVRTFQDLDEAVAWLLEPRG